MDPVTIGFVAFQIGVSLYNQWQNNSLTTRIKEEQRQAKLNEVKNSQRRDMERFMRNCQLQEEFETQAHLNKMEKYKQDFLYSLIKMAHKENLDNHYHLNVSPYVIQRSLIPMNLADLENTRQELFCILTGSNNKVFNEQVLPYLDDSICDLISKFWNESSNHTICYYQNLWDFNDSLFSNEDLENIKSLINTPTISISPLFQKDKEGFQFVIKVSAWGMGTQDTVSCEIPTEVRFDALPNKYSLSEIYKIIDKITPQAICAIGQIADVFYWVNYFQTPILPSIIERKIINISFKTKETYGILYSQLFRRIALVSATDNNDVPLDNGANTPKDIFSINLYNHPSRIISFLQNILYLTGKSHLTDKLIRETLIAIYHSKVDEGPKCMQEIVANKINVYDCKYFVMLATLAYKYNITNLDEEIIHIITQKIKDKN